ncbi:MAG: aldo/keto reductase [Clostridiales Family XIII bacterium]|nr:aldo/keto reductase [Clostridiales Family XIII bacterium]
MNAGVVGLGCEYLDNKPYEDVARTIHAAVDAGVNIMDVFMPGEEVRANIGRALKGKRGDVLIQGHFGSVSENGQYAISRDFGVCKTVFEELFSLLMTDYIDFGMLFFMDTEKEMDEFLNGEAMNYLTALKREGRIRAIGASSHNPLVAKQIARSGAVDLIMFSVNPAFDLMPSNLSIEHILENDFTSNAAVANPDRRELYEVCEREQVSITVMKALGGGKLLSAEHTPFAKPLTVAQCINYALSRPAVVSALVGCKSPEEVSESVGYLEADDAQKDYASITATYPGGFEGSCVYCGHCQPCPAGIDIASVNKYLDIALVDEDNVPPGVKSHYLGLAARGDDCIGCGSCEEKCPFGVPVMENMRKADIVFRR